MTNKTFYGILVPFFVGVFAVSYWDVDMRLIGAISIFSVLFLGQSLVKKSNLVFIAVILFAFCAGVMRLELAKDGAHSLDVELGKKVEFIGIICSEPSAKELSLNFCFYPDESKDRILVRAERFPEYVYGDRISITGILELPENFESYEGGPEFNYIMYLAKDNIRYIMSRPEVTKLGEGYGSRVIAGLYTFKGHFMRNIENLLSEPESSLLGGILLGETSSLPKDVTDDFRAAGLTHILGLSGYNVNIVAESLLKALSFLPRLYGSLLGGISILLFALMTGASQTTIRASIMALIGLLSRGIARKYNVARALTLAAFLMVLHNPYILAFDVSFQLSFLATIGIVYVSPIVSQWLKFVPEKYKLREMCATTLGTQLFVTPYLLYTMGQLSIVSLLSNILILAFIPYSMLLGFLAATLGFLSYTIATPLAWITQAMLWYIIHVAQITSGFPFASIQIHISSWLLMCTYTVFGLYLNRASQKRNLPVRSPN